MGIEVVAQIQQPSLRLWRHENLILLDIEPGLSIAKLLEYEQPYHLILDGLYKKREHLRGGAGLYWPEDHIVSTHPSRTTLAFTADQLSYIKESPLTIAQRMNRMLLAQLDIDESIVESAPGESSQVV